MKTFFKYTWPALAIATLAACSEDSLSTATTEPVDPHNGKELIAFGGDDQAATRAYPDLEAFTSETKIVLRIKAEENAATPGAARYTEAVAYADGTEHPADCEAHSPYGLNAKHSHVAYKTTDNNYRYWDDAFGRKSMLTVYALAVPGKSITDNKIADNIFLKTSNGTGQTDVNSSWYTITGTENTMIAWDVPTEQNATNRIERILAYSNNIRDNSDSSIGDNEKGRYHQENTGEANPPSWTPSMEKGRLAWQSQKPSDNTVTTGKFDQGHMVFKHAVSWITLVLKEDDGFKDNDANDFAWTNNSASATQSITLHHFNTAGNLDVSKKLTDANLWTITASADITQMDEQTGTPAEKTTRTLHAIVLPGTDLYNSTSGAYGEDNVIEFEIDAAKYYVKGNQIAKAIRTYYTTGEGAPATGTSPYASFEKIEPGKHYFINIKVAKKGITDITAAILPWENVTSEDAVAQNTYPEFTLEDRGTRLVETDAAQFSIYRAAKTAADFITGTNTPNWDWKSNYTTDGKATKTWHDDTDDTGTDDDDHWTTDWYWFNNKTYYHFRAAGTGASKYGDVAITENGTDGDYFTINSGIITEPITADNASTTNYRDFLWGAPFKDISSDTKITYDVTNGTGFDNTQGEGTAETDHQISKAIGATKSQIKMLLFHVTSQITVNVTTAKGPNSVVLESGGNKTTVKIVNFLPNGIVRMGNGAVTPTTTDSRTTAIMSQGIYSAETASDPAKVDGFKYGIVPQALSWSSPTAGSIGLEIETPDGNKYYITDLSQYYSTVTTTNLKNPYTESKSVSGTTLYKVGSWYPNYRYTYNITVTKKGIDNITAAVLPWEEVISENIPIDLEN